VPARVLVVDDDAGIRESATLALQKAGYRTLQASNAATARDLLREHDRVAQGRQQHRRPQERAARARAGRGEQGQRIVPRPGQQRVADPDRIVALTLGPFGKREERRRLGAAFHHLFAGR